MGELFDKLGFLENPFSRFSAEEEVDYLEDIYIQPRYFQSLLSDLLSGASRFVFGERGSGKSALILELNRELSKRNALSVLIQKYDDIPLENNDKHLLLLIIRNILNNFIIALTKNPFLLKKLNKYDKEKLSILIRDFYRSISKQEYEDVYNKVTKFKTKNLLKRLFNAINRPINIAISSSIEIGSDFICKSLNLPKVANTTFYKSYLPELKIETLSQNEKESYFLQSYKLLKDTLIDLTRLIQKVGYVNTIVFMDRIDEYRALDGKINNMVLFTEQILKDTDLLYQNGLSLVFSIWTEVKRKLNEKGVRFDKFKPIDITWTNEDIARILQKRLDHFAINKPYNMEQLFESIEELDSLIELAHKSPRDLIRLFSTIYDEQSIKNINSSKLEALCILEAKVRFCKEYDYYSIFPSKMGTKEDIVSIINKMLRVGKIYFRSTDLVNVFKFSTQSANSYIKIMKDYSLIIENDQVATSTKEYIITDPKVKFLINNKIKSLRDSA